MGLFATGGILAGAAAALEPGDDVTLLLRADGPQPHAGATIIFLGGPVGTIDASACQPGATNAPVQAVNLLHPGEPASGRIEAIVVFQTGGGSEPIEPGTRLGDVTGGGACTIGGVIYKKYGGKVE